MLTRMDNQQKLENIHNKKTCLEKKLHPTSKNISFQHRLTHAEAISFISGRKFTTIYFHSKAFTIALKITQRS